VSVALASTGATRAADPAPAATPTDGKKVDWENMTFDQRKKLRVLRVPHQCGRQVRRFE
jgi:hypothetical protein